MYDYALTKVGNATFIALAVADSVLNSPSQRSEALNWARMRFRCPAALVGSRNHDLWGDKNVVEFLQDIDLARLPWRRVAA